MCFGQLADSVCSSVGMGNDLPCFSISIGHGYPLGALIAHWLHAMTNVSKAAGPNRSKAIRALMTQVTLCYPVVAKRDGPKYLPGTERAIGEK